MKIPSTRGGVVELDQTVLVPQAWTRIALLEDALGRNFTRLRFLPGLC